MKIHFISLGCDKNLVDSEQMLGILSEKGFSFTDDEREADIIIINSCCFINDAKEESINAIIGAGELKKEGRLKYLIVAGCLAQRYSREIEEELPEVDALIGTTAFGEIASVLERLRENEASGLKQLITEKRGLQRLENPGVKRMIATPGHYAYLKISEGCDKNCTYCIIPKIRGPYRSIPMERLIADAEDLSGKGVRELILVAQETTLYGKDLYGKKSLPELLHRLCAIEGIRWIRLLYCYPEEIDDDLISVMKEEEKICNYLDLPIQHCSDHILKRMGRRTGKRDIVSIIGKLRKEIPGIALRTTLISGFPGESEEEHEELKAFVREMRFERLGVFTYSCEEGTAAAAFDDQIEEAVKERRRDEIMALQQDISAELLSSCTGEEAECIIEGRIPEDHVYAGRTFRDAPDVDGLVFIDEKGVEGELMTGDFVRVRITYSGDYDLKGEVTKNEKSS